MKKDFKNGSGIAFLHLLVFVFLYLTTGAILTVRGVDKAFYQLPSP